MKTRKLVLRTSTLALALGVAALAAPDARASLIQWKYDWSASPSAVTAGGGKITLSNESPHNAANNSSVVATNLKTFSTASPLTPDTFTALGGKYTLKLTLTDVASGMSGFVLFTGQLQGSFSTSNANVTNQFFMPTTQYLGLGTNFYTVTLNSYSPPGPPEQGNLGSIGAFVQVRSLKELVPEPSSMALAGVGVTLAGLGAWRRWRRKGQPAPAPAV